MMRRVGRVRRGAIQTGGAVATGSSVNFALLFGGVLQSIQTDLGLTYGGTMKAIAGASPPVVGLTGSTTATPVPVRVFVGAGTAPGNNYSLSFDGGNTFPEFGATSASVPIAALPGMSVSFTPGTYLGDEVYDATCSGIADQSSSGLHYTQAVGTKQPVLTVGLQGKPGLLFDGIDDSLNSLLSLVAPGTIPHYFWAVFRQTTWTLSDHLVGDASGAGLQVFQRTSSPTMAVNNGNAAADIAAPALGTWADCELVDTNSAGDTTKIGTAIVTHNNGNSSGTGIIMAAHSVGQYGNIEVLALGFCTILPNWPIFRAAVAAFYGGSVVL